MPSLWTALAPLKVRIDDMTVQRREQPVSSEFTRVTSTVVLQGGDAAGHGEDVTYTPEDHDDFPADVMLAGTWTLDEYSRRLDELELWTHELQMEASRDYRRWAFESAALDLALQQAGRSLAEAVGRPSRRSALSLRRGRRSTRTRAEPRPEFADVEKDGTAR
jgi:L-alanine-DL-glutamate epimerase-like enolase superfamily enzyme